MNYVEGECIYACRTIKLAPADVDRLLPSIITIKYFNNKQLSVSWGYTYFELAFLYNENRLFFILTFSFYFLDFCGPHLNLALLAFQADH
jgi:hypothetical protein